MPKVLDGYCSKSPQPREIAEKEAKEFIQIIEDASSYMFGYNHSIGYCMIGYLCAYLRYYYPAEFITALLNNAKTDDDVKGGSELAHLYHISIVPPKFGISKDKYQYDKETNVIAKGIASVKFMSAAIGNELYALAHDNRPETFMDLLLRIDNETSLNSRQRDILIKVDYFSDYGNAKELLRMVEVFSFFKNGTMKKISKEKLSAQFEKIVRKYSTDVSKSGAPAKSYTILDMHGLLNEFERRIRDLHIHDFDYKSKMQNQLENMGYIDLTTNKPEDRRKLMIMDIRPLIGKEDKQIWGYALWTRSIGSGKTARLTLRANIYDQQPVAKHDVILATDVSKNYKGYWYLNAFGYVI